MSWVISHTISAVKSETPQPHYRRLDRLIGVDGPAFRAEWFIVGMVVW
jgi:hypothetical protein